MSVLGDFIRSLMLLLALAPVGAAHARGTASGLGVPQYGGAFAGVGESGVHGLPFNPASAAVPGLELGADLTGFLSNYWSRLQGEEAEGGISARGVPFLAAAASIPKVDWLGFGVTFGAPYARAAGEATSTSPQRFHGLSGGLWVLSLDATAAIEPVPGIQLGGGVAFQNLTGDSRYALDTGAVLTELFGEDMEPLIGEPWLEGEVDITKVEGQGKGGIVGARVTAIEGWTLAGSYRTVTRFPMTADLDLLPSNEFTLLLESDIEGEMVMPPEAHGMVARDMGRFRLAAEGQWIGWSHAASTSFELVNPELGSRDAVMEAVLVGYGLTDVSDLGRTQMDRNVGYVDTYGGGLRLDMDAGKTEWMVRSFYSSRATPDAWVHPGNLDFASLDNRVGVTLRTDVGLDVGLSLGWYYVPDLVNLNSKASFLADPEEGPVMPSGNGLYTLDLYSAGVNLVYRIE